MRADAQPRRAKSAEASRSRGLVAAVAAYLSWGMFPIYFKAVSAFPALRILAHRIVWSMLFLAILATAQRRWGELVAAFRPGRRRVYAATTLLIAANWLLFIWAVNSGRVLESSLGYFVNPLVSVVLGAVFLHERLSRWQTAAVALAGAGVVALVVRLGAFPWVALALAATFGLYGLLRKTARIDPVVGLLVETTLLAPVALAYLLALPQRGGADAHDPGTVALLALSGVITPLPLIWFGTAVRSLRLATMGILQYLAPSGQFLLAVALYREPFTSTHAAAFGCIWASLALYTFDALRARATTGREPLALD
jgi:chloramphenicol-sensitive protein RarD